MLEESECSAEQTENLSFQPVEGIAMPARKFTEMQAVEALLACYGNVSAAARALGVKHSTLFYRLKKSVRLQEARMEAEEQALDIAEDSLIKAVKAGEAWAVCFLLKTKGKRRGYVERQETNIQLSGEADFLAALRGSGRMIQD